MNKQRERLIELIDGSNVLQCCGCHYNSIKYYENKIADYLIENGVIVPPCKVGDMVYYVFNNTIIEYQVASIVIYRYSQRIIVLGRSQYFELSDFGKTVFLTKEEAEEGR